MSHGHSHSHGGGHGHSHGGHQEDQQRIPTNFLQACTTGTMGIVIAFWDPVDSVHMADESGVTALHWAALNGHAHVIRFLLDNGCPKDKAEAQGQTALHFAASQNQCEVIDILLDAGFDPRARDVNNNTPHGTATCNQAFAALHLLQTRCPADPTHADNQGNTLLAWSCYMGDVNMAKHCHEMFNVPVETFGKFNRSPLHWAAREGHTDVCIWLMSKGLDPHKEDSEGKSAYDWAKERNHVEAADALKIAQKNPTERNIGTFKVLFQSFNGGNKSHLVRLAILVVYAIVCYALLAYLPPIMLWSMLTGWITKNNLTNMSIKPRLYNHKRVDPQQEQLAQMPKTFEDANQAGAELWRREPCAVVGIPLLIGFQLMTMSGHGDLMSMMTFGHSSSKTVSSNSISNGNEHQHTHGDIEMNIPFAVVISLLAAKVFAVIVKALSHRDAIIPDNRNKPIAEYPFLEAVDKKNWEDVKADKEIFDPIALIRRPARAFYCEQLGCVYRRFDSWSVTLDCALSHANMRFFFFFILSLWLSQFFMLRATWDNAMIKNGCLVVDHSGTVDHHDWAHHLHPVTHDNHHDNEHQHEDHHSSSVTFRPFNNRVYNWISVITSLLLQANPCPSPKTWLGGYPFPKLTMSELLFSTEQTRADTITILLPLTLLIILSVHLFLIITNAMVAATTAENKNGNKVPSNEGGMTTSKRAGHGYGSVFGEGSALANLFLFFIGKDGERWEGCMTIPPALKKFPNPDPLVCPPPKKGGKHSH